VVCPAPTNDQLNVKIKNQNLIPFITTQFFEIYGKNIQEKHPTIEGYPLNFAFFLTQIKLILTRIYGLSTNLNTIKTRTRIVQEATQPKITTFAA
jgi:hypothetical protein